MKMDRLDTELSNEYSYHAHVANLLRESMLERHQLYALAISLLLSKETDCPYVIGDELVLREEDLNIIGKYMLLMKPNDFNSKELCYQLVPIEKEDVQK
jgi:hypothetical protein